MDNDLNTPPAAQEAQELGDFAELIDGVLWRTRRNAARYYERDVRTIDRWRRVGNVRTCRYYRGSYPWTMLCDADLEQRDDAARAAARGAALTKVRGL